MLCWNCLDSLENYRPFTDVTLQYMNLGFLKFIVLSFIYCILKVLNKSRNLYFMATEVRTVITCLLSSCTFACQCFGGTLHFDQEIACLTETSVVHSQKFRLQNPGNNKQNINFLKIYVRNT
jgi:hypothetical protein